MLMRVRRPVAAMLVAQPPESAIRDAVRGEQRDLQKDPRDEEPAEREEDRDAGRGDLEARVAHKIV